MVEKRSPWTPLMTFVGTFFFGSFFMLILPGKHSQPPLLLTLLRSDVLTDTSILLFIGIFAAVIAYGSLKLSRAEFVHLDGTRLHFGRKGIGRTWTRASYSKEAVVRLRWDLFTIDRNTVVRCLMFEVSGVTEHALEGLALTDADPILDSCKRLGYDTFRDDSEPMLLDIEKRGWLINPWRPDAVESHPKEQK